jgi:bifunctional hydroxylase/dehydrase
MNRSGACAAPGLVWRPHAETLRPDGYVAWASARVEDTTGLAEALLRWFGAPGLGR